MFRKDCIFSKLIAVILVMTTFATIIPAGFSIKSYANSNFENQPVYDIIIFRNR